MAPCRLAVRCDRFPGFPSPLEVRGVPAGGTRSGTGSGLIDGHAKFLERLADATALLKTAVETLGSRMGAHQQGVKTTFTAAVRGLAYATTDSFTQPTQQLNEYLPE